MNPSAAPGGSTTSPAPARLLRPGDRPAWRHFALPALGLVLIALFCIHEVGNTDTGFHLRAGRFILDNRTWPRNDTLTFTRTDQPYVDTTWGYQVLLALAHQWVDASGMIGLSACLALGAFYLTYRTIRLAPVDPLSAGLLLPLGGIACAMRFEIRPELLSLFLLALILHILVRRAEGRSAPLWALPAILLVWANCHSFFMLGWGAMAAFGVGLLLRDRRVDRPLFGWSVVAVLICVVNPYGLRGVTFPLTLLTRFDSSNVFSQSISELTSPFFLRSSPQMPFVPYWPVYSFRFLAVLSVVALVPAFRARRYWAILLWLMFFPLAAKAIRNMPLLIITCLPMMAWSLPAHRLLDAFRLEGRTRRAVSALTGLLAGLVLMALCLRVVHSAYYIDMRQALRFGTGWNRLELPIDAVRYAKQAGLTGRMLNHLNFGGYMIWAQPEPVFIDGRLEVVGEEFYQRYLAILESQNELEAAVKQYGIRWMIFPYAISPKLLVRMSGDPRWRLAYVDHIAAIFIRSDAGLEQCIDPRLAELRALPRGVPPFGELPGLGGPARPVPWRRWIEGVVERASFPTEDYNLGIFHLYRQELPQGAARFVAAIRASGGRFYEMYNNLGAVLFRMGQSEEAARCYRIVLEEDPGNAIARQRVTPIAGRR